MNRRLAIPVAVLALGGFAGGVAWAAAGDDSGSGANGTAGASSATTTATVEKRDLVQHETVEGTLGYGDVKTLYAQSMGTVTRLREPGAVVRRGRALYWVNGEPVTLMYGNVPMWRRIDSSADGGRDIRQLERNLVALGYDPDGDIEIDDEWDSATTAAVERWQEDKGLRETGVVELGQIAFLPGPRRVGQLKTTRGALLQPGAEIMDTSSTWRLVAVDLEADKQSLVNEGDQVDVELPDGTVVRGRIAKVGKTAESELDPETGQQTEPTIPLEIRLVSSAKAGDLDGSPVDVELQKDRAENVLTVPISALVALAEGGYAVEVVGAGGSTRLVPVEPGLFADGMVEISGEGIEKGMKVVVPA